MQTSINNVETAVATETSARQAADSALDTRVDALEAVVTKYSANIGNGSSTAIVVSHALNSADVVVSVREVATGNVVVCGVNVTDANSVTLNFSTAPASNALRVTVLS